MPYISYFDLLGTKGFCEDKDIYFENITLFYKSIKSLSRLFDGQGRVGVFSDCAYAESNDLEYLLVFLVELRDRLNAQGLFFNAYVKRGQLGVENVAPSRQEELFGVVFTKPSIADLYISQMNFKGVGICIDNDLKLLGEIQQIEKFTLIDSIYISRKKFEDGSIKTIPVKYYDIAYRKPMYGIKDIKDSLHIFFQTFYSAYINSPKHGSYYFSAIVNYLRSFDSGFSWDLSKSRFEKVPVPFEAVCKMINSSQYEQIKNLPGIDYLIFILLDIVYNTDDLDDEEKKSITLYFTEFPSMKDKYINSLEDIPKVLFTEDQNRHRSNRELLISICRNDFSKKYANSLIS